MGEENKKLYAERWGNWALHPFWDPLSNKDSTLKKVGKIAYIIASPPIFGQAVIAGHLVDEVHEKFHIPEIIRGMEQFRTAPLYPRQKLSQTPSLSNKQATNKLNIASGNKLTPRSPIKTGGFNKIATLPTIPKMKLHSTKLGNSLPFKPYKPTLGIKNLTRPVHTNQPKPNARLILHQPKFGASIHRNSSGFKMPISRPSTLQKLSQTPSLSNKQSINKLTIASGNKLTPQSPIKTGGFNKIAQLPTIPKMKLTSPKLGNSLPFKPYKPTLGIKHLTRPAHTNQPKPNARLILHQPKFGASIHRNSSGFKMPVSRPSTFRK